MKKYYPGVVIGYTANLLNNLIYYDDRHCETDPSIDYNENLVTG